MYGCDHPTMTWPAKSSLFFLLTVIFHLVHFSLAGLFAPATKETIHGRRNGISAELFNSLEELSRLVDISYCVGTTGVQNPFECPSHCNEFQGFELVTVRPISRSCPKLFFFLIFILIFLVHRRGIPALSSQIHAAT